MLYDVCYFTFHIKHMNKYIKILSGIIATPTIGTCSYLWYKHTLPKENKFNIVFDMDLTLLCAHDIKKFEMIHEKNYPIFNSTVYIIEDNGIVNRFNVWRRPYAQCSLGFLSLFNNLFLMTRATSYNSNTMTKSIGLYKYFTEISYRDEGALCKDVTKFGASVIRGNTLLVDDKKSNFCCDVCQEFHNCVCESDKFYHITEYCPANKNDKELLKLCGHVLWTSIKNDYIKVINWIKS